MAAVKQHINPDMLVWAMKQAGITKPDLASELSIEEGLVDAWLTKDEAPGLTQLRDLAKALHRPTSLFFMAEPPIRRAVQASFRQPIGSKGARQLTGEETVQLRSAERRQKIAIWAANAVEAYTPPALPTRDASPEATAHRVQHWLRWGIDEQVKATSKTAVTRMLRVALEDHGLMVLQLAMSKDACRGFSLYDATVPLIAYNSSHFASVRNFTILHELGHLLSHQQAVCDRPEDEQERWCDRFAAAFLIPGHHLARYMEKYLGLTRVANDDVESVRRISNRYKASYQCVALRLFDLGFASWSLYEYICNTSPEVDTGGGFSAEPQTVPLVRLREYGATFPRLILAARDRGKIHEIDVRKYLNVDAENLAKIRRRLEDEG